MEMERVKMLSVREISSKMTVACVSRLMRPPAYLHKLCIHLLMKETLFALYTIFNVHLLAE